MRRFNYLFLPFRLALLDEGADAFLASRAIMFSVITSAA